MVAQQGASYGTALLCQACVSKSAVLQGHTWQQLHAALLKRQGLGVHWTLVMAWRVLVRLAGAVAACSMHEPQLLCCRTSTLRCIMTSILCAFSLHCFGRAACLNQLSAAVLLLHRETYRLRQAHTGMPPCAHLQQLSVVTTMRYLPKPYKGNLSKLGLKCGMTSAGSSPSRARKHHYCCYHRCEYHQHVSYARILCYLSSLISFCMLVLL